MDIKTTSTHETLKKYFGYDSFRLNQEDVINRTLNHESSLVIMPTGGGKSICYQLPAILLEGLTIVISPLIALMQDQVSSLKENGIKAEALNSSCSEADIQIIQERVAYGDIKLLYVSPEKALTWGFMQWIQSIKVDQIAIDEAHCVSVWGNDFRPEYTQLSQLIRLFPNIPVVALTATADAATQKDIKIQLGIYEAKTFLSSFERKNIEIDVLPAKKRIETIKKFVKAREGKAGIVYCLSKKNTEQVAAKLQQEGIAAAYYHGGMGSGERARVQDQFIKDEIQIICATIAFGMGIDKPNIRWVIHHNLPKNIESYYQEIGRAGRDGEAAEALLFAGYNDMTTLNKFVDDIPNQSHRNVQRSKLDRMWEFTQTSSCRTNFVLNYFGEYKEAHCGHCDHCLNPPTTFDGSLIAQKAISACLRLNRLGKSVGANMLVDVLRGSKRRELVEEGFNQIKTYGAGADLSWKDWIQYITQLIDRGYLGIDFSNRNVLQLTSLSNDVLKGETKVLLSRLADPKAKKVVEQVAMDADLSKEQITLLEKLKELRNKIAKEADLPAYTIFNNASLKDMAINMPSSKDDFSSISGVGESKLEKYSDVFVKMIAEYISANGITKPQKLSKVVKNAPKKKLKKKLDKKFVDRDLSEHEMVLLEELKGLRYKISTEMSLPAFTVFSNADLQQIVLQLPKTSADLINIKGIGQLKVDKFADSFLPVVIKFETEGKEFAPEYTRIHTTKQNNSSEFTVPSLTATNIETLDLYKQGKTITEIAEARELNVSTIKSHLFRLALHGEDVELSSLTSEDQKERVLTVWNELGRPDGLKEIYEGCEQQIDYPEI
ncbi:DNA helicase RecQ, partial [Oleiphilus sp. HI0123]